MGTGAVVKAAVGAMVLGLAVVTLVEVVILAARKEASRAEAWVVDIVVEEKEVVAAAIHISCHNRRNLFQERNRCTVLHHNHLHICRWSQNKANDHCMNWSRDIQEA